jgi:UDP-N-acetylmuramoyl-L-alanyl-D-glutamate--2,6-diaminopimelate ligase
MISALKAFIRNNIFYNLYKLYKAKLAIAIYNDPSKDMFVIGITGTNGKTTSSFIIHHIFNTLVDKAFLLGTNEIKYGTEAETNTSKMTSPDPMKIQEYLSRAKEK